MNERIRELRKELGLTLEKFGEHIGVKKSVLSQIENGRNVTAQMKKSICREFNVNPTWLETGEGDMFITLTYQEELMQAAANLLKNKDSVFVEAVQAFLITYDQLDDSHRESLEDTYKLYCENLQKNKE